MSMTGPDPATGGVPMKTKRTVAWLVGAALAVAAVWYVLERMVVVDNFPALN